MDTTSFSKWASNNPDLLYAGAGILKGMLDAPKQQALTEQQIAQTMYSPWLKTGPGDIANVPQANILNNALQGYTAGTLQKQNDKMNSELMKALNNQSRSNIVAPNTEVLKSGIPLQEARSQEKSSPYLNDGVDNTYVSAMKNSNNVMDNIFSDALFGNIPKQPSRNIASEGQLMPSPYRLNNWR